MRLSWTETHAHIYIYIFPIRQDLVPQIYLHKHTQMDDTQRYLHVVHGVTKYTTWSNKHTLLGKIEGTHYESYSTYSSVCLTIHAYIYHTHTLLGKIEGNSYSTLQIQICIDNYIHISCLVRLRVVPALPSKYASVYKLCAHTLLARLRTMTTVHSRYTSVYTSMCTYPAGRDWGQ